MELRARHVEAQRDVRAGANPAFSIASRMTSIAASFDGRSGAKPPSSPTAVDRPRLLSEALQRVEHLDAPAQRLGEARRADRHDHELLHVDVVVGMRPAVDDVHHRHGQAAARVLGRGARTAACRRRGGRLGDARATPRGSRWRPAATWSACRRARSGAGRAPPGRRRRVRRSAWRISPLTFATALVTPLPRVAPRVAVAQLERLARAGRCARRRRGEAACAVREHDLAPRRSDCRASRGSRSRDVLDGGHGL